MHLSVIIPSWKDPYLHKSVQSILDNFETDFEIIPVIDGYELAEPLPNDSRVKPIFHKKNKGMREAINTGVANASGKYLMRTDEHCLFPKGMDRVVLDEMQDNWIMVPERRFLDPTQWKVMDKKPIQFEKLIVSGNHNKFAAVPWDARDKALLNVPVASTMAMQGSLWFMPRAWWNHVIGRLETDGYGPLYQDSTEMQMKTWQAGGDLVLTKRTWYAHKHRDFSRTHNHSNREARKSWDHSLAVWGDYYWNHVRPKWKAQPFSISPMTA